MVSCATEGHNARLDLRQAALITDGRVLSAPLGRIFSVLSGEAEERMAYSGLSDCLEAYSALPLSFFISQHRPANHDNSVWPHN